MQATPKQPARTEIALPVRIQRDANSKRGWAIKSTGADYGWATIYCRDVAHAEEIMARYPSAAMPCWGNPKAPWNRR